MRRENLSIVTRAMATRVLFQGKRAIEVEHRRGGKLLTIHAKKEVILSPVLSIHSGLGLAIVKAISERAAGTSR